MINPEYLKALNDPNSWDPFAHMTDAYKAHNVSPPQVKLLYAGTGPTCPVEIFIYRYNGRKYVGRITHDGLVSIYLQFESLDLLTDLCQQIKDGRVEPANWQPRSK